MTSTPRFLRVVVPTLALFAAAACSNSSYDQPNRVTWDPASTTAQGTGTNGGTDVDGEGPGGPRDPNRLVTPNASTAPAAPSDSSNSQDPNMNPHWMTGVH